MNNQQYEFYLNHVIFFNYDKILSFFLNHAVSPCDSEPCENGGECLRDGDSFNCKCLSGYKGERCQDKGIRKTFRMLN